MNTVQSQHSPYPFSAPMSALRTFIVEDSPVILENLVATLEELDNVTVVGHAADEATAVKALASEAEAADLLIVDVFLKQGSGLGVLMEAQKRQIEARRVVLTNYATADIRRRCMALGAERVFDKSRELEDLIAYCAELAGSASRPASLS